MNFNLKKIAIEVLLVILGTGATVIIFEFPQYSDQLNVWALIATLIVLVWYAYDTHRIADQTVEANLRPVILRSGYIQGWDQISFEFRGGKLHGQYLEFSVLKHIAKNIEGFMVVNGKKYTLLFGGEISKINGDSQDAIFSSSWGWMKADTILRAAFDPTRSEKSENCNQIRITYQDIEGNLYFTEEDKDFHQVSGKF